MKLSLSLAIILASLTQANAATYMLLSQTNAFAAGITNQAKAYTDSVAGGANWTADGTTNSDLAGIAMVHGVVATNSIQAPMLVVSTSGSGAVVRPGGSAASVTRYDSATSYTLPLNSGLFQVDADGSFGFASANNNFTTVDTRIGRSSAGVASVAGWLVTNRLELLGSLIAAAEDIAVADIDVSTGSVFSKSLGADTVFTFSNLSDGQWWTVILTNGASWTVTWPTVTWLSGSAPVMDTGAGVINVFSFTRQNGVTIGDVSQQASAILNAIAALANGTGALTNDGAGNFGYYNGYAPLASPALTGDPTVPTATPGDNDTTAASTAFVTAAVAAGGGGGDTNIIMSGLGATTAFALGVTNSTEAAAGAQQASPAFQWGGNGWGTTLGSSQPVTFRTYVLPGQSTSPFGSWILQSSINGGAFNNVLTIDNAGGVTSSGSITAGGGLTAGTSLGLAVSGRSRINSLSDGNWQMHNNAVNGFTSLRLGPNQAVPSSVFLRPGDGSGADAPGGAFSIEGGLSTGTASGGALDLTTSLSGEASSSTSNGKSIRFHAKAKHVALTHDTATTIETFSLAANKILGGELLVTTYATNSTPNLQARTTALVFQAVAVSTTITGTIDVAKAGTLAASSGTITETFTLLDNGNNTFSIQLQANSDLSSPTERCKVVVTALNGNDTVTITDP